MKINNERFDTVMVFPSMLTVPDCFVSNSNKIGSGHGEAKLYIAPKKDMRDFYGSDGFTVKCFMLKSDLMSYMMAIKTEYENPSQLYSGMDELPLLWKKRFDKIKDLDNVIFFEIHDQEQIAGDRGYVNSNDDAYSLIREISLPLVSYIYSEKVHCKDRVYYYWKLFVDFDLIAEKKRIPLVFSYRQKGLLEANTSEETTEIMKMETSKSRDGQEKYRSELLEQCHICPFTKISDERLLIASHIKPWAVSSENEKVDPYNGYMLSPMYDKLFDKGFITILSNKHVLCSDFISSYTWKLIGLKHNSFLEFIVMDEKREEYLKFHHESVFKGSIDL